MAIFYIPHDRTLTYLMRNSKQHRVSSSAVVCAGCGLAECSEYLAWQARHVLRAPNDVFICNHILLRTHYGALTAYSSLCWESSWLCVLVPGCGRWDSSELSILTPTFEMRKVLRLNRPHQQASGAGHTNICSQRKIWEERQNCQEIWDTLSDTLGMAILGKFRNIN